MKSSPSLKSIVQENSWLLGALFVYLVLYFVYYPPIFAYRDESAYLAMSYVLRQGKVFLENTGIPFTIKIKAGNHIAPMYSLGHSVALMPFTFLGIKTIYLYTLLCHLTGVFVFKKFAAVLKCESKWPVVLYLFFPAFVMYSRTIMSDIPVAVLFITGCMFYFKKDTPKWKSGVCFGMILLIKTALVFYSFPFVFMLMLRGFREKNFRPLISFALGITPFALTVACLNTFIYGSPLSMGYSPALKAMGPTEAVGVFSWQHFWRNMPHYLKSMMFAYPLMLVIGLASPKIRRPEILLSFTMLLVFYSFWFFIDYFPNDYAVLVLSTRYIFPIIPFLFLGYGEFIEQILTKLPPLCKRGLTIAISGGLIGLCWAVNAQHQIRLNEQFQQKEIIYRNTEKDAVLFYDYNSSELLQMEWGRRDYREHEETAEVLEYLKDWDRSVPTYVVQRSERGYDVTHSRITEEQLAEIRKTAEVERVAEGKDLTLYKLS